MSKTAWTRAPREVIRRALALLGVASLTAAQAAQLPPDLATARADLEARVAAVRAAMEQQAAKVETGHGGEEHHVAQWFNWPNWANWPNWPNWGNWANWFNR